MFISKISKELSKVEVPNFTGLTVSQPKEKAKSSNLELRIYNARQIMKRLYLKQPMKEKKLKIFIYNRNYML